MIEYIENFFNVKDYDKSNSDNLTVKIINKVEDLYGKKVKPYFRHKFDGDVDNHPMTLWHSEWQGHFPKIEIDFKLIE